MPPTSDEIEKITTALKGLDIQYNIDHGHVIICQSVPMADEHEEQHDVVDAARTDLFDLLELAGLRMPNPDSDHDSIFGVVELKPEPEPRPMPDESPLKINRIVDVSDYFPSVCGPAVPIVPPVTIRFKVLEGGRLPTKAWETDAGIDLYATKDGYLRAWQVLRVPLGIAWECPPGWYAQLCGRSSMAAKGMHVLAGCMDAGYRGEWVAVLSNSTSLGIAWSAGDKLVQAVIYDVPIVRIEQADTLSPSDRGDKGFGSSGR